MEVHPPHGPIRSPKDFLLHLLAITIGLLIALSLEASVGWVHDRRLVREARENIAQEIHDNQQSLAKEMTALPTEEQQLERLLTVVNAEERGGAATPDQHLVWTVTRLSDSSWNGVFNRCGRAYELRGSAAVLAALRLATDVQQQHRSLPGVAA